MFYTIIGTQWGDEGKGKIVDWLASKADTVVRFQGGNNAGHTLQIKDEIYKLNLLPSGIIRGKKCIIGNGVILDPWALLKEIEKLKTQNILIDHSNFMIAENICLILPIHKIIDELNENLRGTENIGTTKRGIGPAYEDKIGRRSIRLCDLEDKETLEKKLNNLLKFHEDRLNKNNIKIDISNLLEELILIDKKISFFSKPTWKILNELQKKETILFEGAQGSMLDIDFGTYPYVTSSNTNSGQIFSGSGFSRRDNHLIFGITKSYTTRVGSGPFPTELLDKTGEYLTKIGKEYGTVTERKRRCGWFDANLVRQSVKISGINNIVLTKLDVLDKLKKIKVCVGYDIQGTNYDYFPSSEYKQNKIIPIYETLEGWDTSTFGITNWEDLPKNAKNYISFLEKKIECEISIISTGPERSQTIDIKKIL